MDTKTRITLIFSFSFLFPGLFAVSAFSFNTSSYYAGSFHTGLTGENGTTSSYTFRSTTTYQPGGNDYVSTASYLSNMGFLSGRETYTPPPEPDEQPPPPPGTSSPSGPSPGPAPPACTYDWVCTDWEPEECPESGVQTRTCSNEGTCEGTEGRPEESRTCTYEEEDDIDIGVRIPDSVNVSGNFTALVRLRYLGEGRAKVRLVYTLRNPYNDVLYRETEERYVEGEIHFGKDFNFSGIEPGERIFSVTATYEGKEYSAGDSFEILREFSEGEMLMIPYVTLLAWITIIIAASVMIWFFAFRFEWKYFFMGLRLRKVKGLLKKVDRSIKKSENLMDDHKPIITRTSRGFFVRVGVEPHPARKQHYIKWIELTAGGRTYRKILRPGDAPEAEFEVDAEKAKARACCSIHGIWKS